MKAQEIDAVIGTLETWLMRAPAEVYNAWNTVSEAADRYSELLDGIS